MPLFEYHCSTCNVSKDIIRTLKDMSEDIHCQECGDVMDKVITSGSFILKGGGWEKDGYGKGGTH